MSDDYQLPIPQISYHNGEWLVQGISFINCGLLMDAEGKVTALVGYNDGDADSAFITFISSNEEQS